MRLALLAGFNACLRSANALPAPDTAVYIADTVGEMALLMRLASVVLLGGSLVPGIGGHNMIEPARMGVPVLTGPHLGNWSDVAGLFRAASALDVVEDAEALATEAGRLLADPAARQRRSAAAQTVVAANRGATERLLAGLSPYLPAAGAMTPDDGRS